MENLSNIAGKKLLRDKTLFAQQVDEDLIMLDEEAGLYFALNSVAGKIWQLLEQPIIYEELLTTLLDLYTVEFADCKRDVDDFLQKLITHKLITVV